MKGIAHIGQRETTNTSSIAKLFASSFPYPQTINIRFIKEGNPRRVNNIPKDLIYFFIVLI
jgi:hypothetical protein